MDYQNKEELYFYFKKIIDGEVAKIVDQLQKDIDALKEEAQVSIEKELKEEQIAFVNSERQNLEHEYNLKLSNFQRNKDMEIMHQRQELLLQLFSRLEAQLTSFVDSDKYKKWLKNKVSLYDLSTFKLIQIASNDSIAKNEFKNQKVEFVNDLIGGFVAYTMDGKNIIDESFKKKISEAKKWFYDHAEWSSEEEGEK